MIAMELVEMAPVLSGLVPLVVIVAAVGWERWQRKQKFRPPQAERLLRPPGHSLAVKLDDLVFRMVYQIVATFAFCAMAGAMFSSSKEFPTFVWLGFGLVLALCGLFAGIWVVNDVKEAENIRLGLRGEQAVAAALHEVADCGFRAFHDFPGGGNWNIDHIVVGPAGVFVIETKARSRVRPRRQDHPEHIVRVCGRLLQFPSEKNVKAIPQAERNADWLAGYLTKMTGEKVEVEAIVVLPGWFVESKEPSSGAALVMNAKYLMTYLRSRNPKLADAQVRRIIGLLDEKCRDVEF